MIGKALFDVLREQHGANFHSFISEKVSPVPGDISCVDMGIRDSLLKDQIWNEVDTVINFAATTNFDERSACKALIDWFLYCSSDRQ